MDQENRALAMFLCAMRYVGVAPYRSLHLSQISRPFALYSRILFFIFAGAILMSLTLDAQRRIRGLNTSEAIVVWLFLSITSVVSIGVLYLGIFQSSRRLRRTFYYWKHVKKISRDVGRVPKADPVQRQTWVLFASMQLGLFVLNIGDIWAFLEIYDWNISKAAILITIINLMYAFSIIFIAYFVLVAIKIGSPLRAINEQLLKMASEVKSNDQKLAHEKLRSLGRAYVSTCELVRQHNSSEEMLLLMLLIGVLVNLGNTVYIVVVNGIYKNDLPLMMIEAIWYMFHVSCGMFLAAPWHKMEDEVGRTRNLICKLMCKVRSAHDPVLAELEVFHIHLTANQPSYTVIGMFTLKRPLILTMMALATTALAIFQ